MASFCPIFKDAFNQHAIWAGEMVTDGRMYAHGDGFEWRYVVENVFEGEENQKQITFDCEAGEGLCYSNDFENFSEYGRRFCEKCMNEQKCTEFVCSVLSEMDNLWKKRYQRKG